MLSIYKPNSKNSGHAAHFSYNPEEKCLFVSMIKQSSWNAQTKNGSFKQDSKDPTKSISAKFNAVELGKFINAFERRVPVNLYHQSDGGSSKINLTPKTSNNDDGSISHYFNFTISKSRDLSFYISFDEGETIALREGLKMCLTNIMKSNIMKAQEDRKKYGKTTEKRD